MFNDTVLYCLFKKPNTKDEFDDLTEVAGQEFNYDYPLKKKEEPRPEDDWTNEMRLLLCFNETVL